MGIRPKRREKEEREWEMLPYKRKMVILAAQAARKEKQTHIMERSSLETDTRAKPSRSSRDKQARKAKSLPKRNAQRQKARAELAASFVADVDRVFFQEGGDKIKRQDDFYQWVYRNRQSVKVHLKTSSYHQLVTFCVHAWWAIWDETRACPQLKGSKKGSIIRCTDDFIASLDLDSLDAHVYGAELMNIVFRERHPDSHLYVGTLFDE